MIATNSSLQCLHGVANGRLRQKELPGRIGKASAPSEDYKRAELPAI
jgi:hypothetical protein